MAKIVYIQTLFCPTRQLLQRNVASVISFGKMLKSEPTDIDVLFTGYADPEYWSEIYNTCKNNFESCEVEQFEKNYGKAYCVNTTSFKYLEKHPETQYILTCDADIVFIENQNTIDRLIEATEKIREATTTPWGLIATNLKEVPAHLYGFLSNKKSYVNKFGQQELILWPTIDGGIAGGCILVNAEAWKKVKGYQAISVYGTDDGFLMKDMCAQNYSISMLSTLSVIHPAMEDVDYDHWKLQIMNKRWNTLDASVEEVELFWQRKKKEQL